MKHIPAVFRADSATAIQQRFRRCKDVASYPTQHFGFAAPARRLDAALYHHQPGLTFGGPGRGGRVHTDDQPEPVLGQGVRGVAQKCHAAALAREPRIGGSVRETCVAFERFLRRKSTSGLRP